MAKLLAQVDKHDPPASLTELTHDEFIKYGFERPNGHQYYFKRCPISNRMISIDVDNFFKTYFYSIPGYRNIQLKWVHQLKTLWFCLTEHELKPNE